MNKAVMLNVGCGGDIRPNNDGWINIDAVYREGVNMVADLNHVKILYPDASVDHR